MALVLILAPSFAIFVILLILFSNGDRVNEDDDVGSQVSDWSSSHLSDSALALHVYESVELDIAFANSSSSSDKKRPFDYPIHLEVVK